MHIGRIAGATHNLGAPKGWDPEKDGKCDALPIRAEPHGEGLARMHSAWMPTLEEIARIAAGAPIYLMVLASFHPPVMLTVGEPPTEG